MNKKIVIWNLKVVEKNLHKEGRTDDAYIVRVALDLLSPNWRIAKSIEDIATSYIEKPSYIKEICQLGGEDEG